MARRSHHRGKSFTLQANSGEVVLTGTNTTQSTVNMNTTLTLSGAGFTGGTTVSLVASNGSNYPATRSMTDLPTQITATFAAGTVPSGTYSIKVAQLTEPQEYCRIAWPFHHLVKAY